MILYKNVLAIMHALTSTKILQFLGDKEYLSTISNSNMTKCTSWTYDTSEWKSTIIHEWDLVCDREPLLKLTQQVTFFGLLCGAFLSGLLSDRYAA